MRVLSSESLTGHLEQVLAKLRPDQRLEETLGNGNSPQ